MARPAAPARRLRQSRRRLAWLLVGGVDTRAATRGDGEVIELELGITVYPPRDKGGRWRAVWHEDGERQQCESVSEEKLAAKLAKVRQRLTMGASNMIRPGADLIAWYLNLDRLPVEGRWSRKHADSQLRLCQRFAAPVIGAVTCQDITVSHTQKIVNAAPTAGEGGRVHRMLSALVCAGIRGGYLVNPMLAEVHWQAGDRPLPAPKVTVAGESALLVDPQAATGEARWPPAVSDLLQLPGQPVLGHCLALLPLTVLVPDRPPPVTVEPGRVDRDPALQLDNRTAGDRARRRENGQAGSLRPREARTVPVIRRGTAAGSPATRVVARRVLRCAPSRWRVPA